jgi:hypothetical protein
MKLVYPLSILRQSNTLGRFLATPTRLLGSKVAPGNPPGAVHLYDEQDALRLDLDTLRDNLTKIRQAIGYPTYDVTLILVDDQAMRSMNNESRGINKATDILSFPFYDAVEPGVLEDVRFDIPDYYMLVRSNYMMGRTGVYGITTDFK